VEPSSDPRPRHFRATSFTSSCTMNLEPIPWHFSWLGPEAIQAQHPHTRPERMKKSPAPRVHAFRREVRRQLYEAYSWFLGEYRKRRRSSKRETPLRTFPVGCFPPALPFVYG
jgi:hypothetical protein